MVDRWNIYERRRAAKKAKTSASAFASLLGNNAINFKLKRGGFHGFIPPSLASAHPTIHRNE
jgi:hypothetical protein